MNLFDFLGKKENPTKVPYADSSSIPTNERQYYKPDEYYTLSAFPGSLMERPVITFEERKKISFPSKRGLFVAEILLLSYCAKGKYPNPKNGYPGLWWFEYGIRDVGKALRSLEEKGFISLDGDTQKYHLTNLGEAELHENEYIPYMHKSKNKTSEGSTFGKEFNVWSINRLIAQNPGTDWRELVTQEEATLTYPTKPSNSVD